MDSCYARIHRLIHHNLLIHEIKRGINLEIKGEKRKWGRVIITLEKELVPESIPMAAVATTIT